MQMVEEKLSLLLTSDGLGRQGFLYYPDPETLLPKIVNPAEQSGQAIKLNDLKEPLNGAGLDRGTNHCLY
jgi:hypothetical protein